VQHLKTGANVPYAHGKHPKSKRITTVWERPVVIRREALMLYLDAELKFQSYIFEALLQGKGKNRRQPLNDPRGLLPA
jgi:hypothetical protein